MPRSVCVRISLVLGNEQDPHSEIRAGRKEDSLLDRMKESGWRYGGGHSCSLMLIGAKLLPNMIYIVVPQIG